MSKSFRLLTTGIKVKRPKPSTTFLNDAALAAINAQDNEPGDVRANNFIEVEGDDVPDALDSFQSLANTYGIPEVIMGNLEKAGFIKPTPIQMQAIPLMMQRREVMCSAPTGSGKTLAFLLPIIVQLKQPKSIGFRAIILAPTRELAKQLHRDFLWISEGTGLTIHIINDVEDAANRFSPSSKQMKDILITTPLRLVCLLSTDPPSLDVKYLRWLVIDECDRLFDAAFREQLATIYKACSHAKRIRRALFSATFDDSLEEWFKMNLDNVVSLVVGGKNLPTHSVKQSLLFVGNEDGKVMALRNLISKGIDVPALIFVRDKEVAKSLFRHLITSGINAECIHSERLEYIRDRLVNDFREGKILFLICTELMGRGIDFKAVNTVINYDCPTNVVSYIHRVGRTGRGGKTGCAITFYTEQDIVYLRKIARVMKVSGCPVPDFLTKEVDQEPSVDPNKSKKRETNVKKKSQVKKKKKRLVEKKKRERENRAESNDQKQKPLKKKKIKKKDKGTELTDNK